VSSCEVDGEVWFADFYRLGLSDFLRGKLVERLKKEEQNGLR
jgi:hypothetical protein